MRPGWRTSELTFSAICGAAIFQLALPDPASLAQAVVRAGACLALGAVAAAFSCSRGRVKGGR